jgi:hypothetical protein
MRPVVPKNASNVDRMRLRANQRERHKMNEILGPEEGCTGR